MHKFAKESDIGVEILFIQKTEIELYKCQLQDRYATTSTIAAIALYQ